MTRFDVKASMNATNDFLLIYLNFHDPMFLKKKRIAMHLVQLQAEMDTDAFRRHTVTTQSDADKTNINDISLLLTSQ